MINILVFDIVVWNLFTTLGRYQSESVGKFHVNPLQYLIV